MSTFTSDWYKLKLSMMSNGIGIMPRMDEHLEFEIRVISTHERVAHIAQEIVRVAPFPLGHSEDIGNMTKWYDEEVAVHVLVQNGES